MPQAISLQSSRRNCKSCRRKADAVRKDTHVVTHTTLAGYTCTFLFIFKWPKKKKKSDVRKGKFQWIIDLKDSD